jgi:hypothetical protein
MAAKRARYEWQEIEARIRAFSLSGPPGAEQPARVKTEERASVEGGPETEQPILNGAPPIDRRTEVSSSG